MQGWKSLSRDVSFNEFPNFVMHPVRISLRVYHDDTLRFLFGNGKVTFSNALMKLKILDFQTIHPTPSATRTPQTDFDRNVQDNR